MNNSILEAIGRIEISNVVTKVHQLDRIFSDNASCNAAMPVVAVNICHLSAFHSPFTFKLRGARIDGIIPDPAISKT